MYWFDGKNGYSIPTIQTTVMDSIGAGDAHVGAVIAGMKMGMEMSEACLLANHIASGVVSTKGASLSQHVFDRIIKNYTIRK